MARPRMLIPLLVGFVLLVAACSVLAQEAAPLDLAQPSAEALANGAYMPFNTPLMPEFERAAAKHDVPLPLLLTLGYFGSHFENRGDAPTIEGGYGVMALRDNNFWHSDSLGEGAGLTKGDRGRLRVDPAGNINAAAAVLSAYAKQMKIDRSKGLQAWLYPVIKYAGLDPEYSRMFAMEIFEELLTGLNYVNSAGETFQFDPQDIGDIDLSDLEPTSAVRGQGSSPLMALPGQQPSSNSVSPLSAQYGPAVWYPAASCNYQTGSYSKNTVVIHTIEGSAAGCLSWFNNCTSQVSAHYVSSQAGGIWQCVDEWYRAWHVGCANNYCIGIENEGYASDASHPQAQYNAVGLLVRDICDSWGIPKSHNACPPGVLGHVDINNCVCGGTHWDPGPGWDWGYFMGVVVGTPPPPTYAATYLGQSYPTTMVAGSAATAWVEFRNDGTATWGHAATRLGTQQPQDRSSVFYTPGNWINAGRPTEVDQTAVTTGQTGRFTFIMTAPATPGTYTEHWKLLQESVTWFGPDVWFQITVTPNTGTISGNVKNSGGTNLVGATVTITGGASTTTDSSGNYTLANIQAGGYTVVASKSGYNDSSAPVTVTAGNTTTQNFTLASSDTTAPSVPTNLAATAVSGTQINLTWTASTDNVGVTGYKIYRGGTQIGTSATTSYSNTGLTPATAYSYTVSAYDAAGNNSAQSTSAGATTPDTIAPSVPAGLSATAISGTQINLTWTASTDNVAVTGYKVYRGGVQIGTSATASYSNTGLTQGTAYTYTVSAYDAAGNNSAQSTSAGATTLDTIAPSVPTNLAATAVSGTTINLTWTASTDNVGVTGYKIYRGGTQIGTSATASYSDTTCASYTSYTYTVSAYDAAANNSAQSTSAGATTWDTTAPSVPTNLSATAISSTRIDLAWTASTDNVGVTGYKIYRDGVQIGTSATVIYSDTTATPGNIYSYQVSAYDARANESAKSTAAEATTLDTIAPSAPTNLGTTVISQTQINLAWTASTDNVGVTGYKVFRDGTQIGTSATTSYSDTTCQSYTSYTYTVSAYDLAGNNSTLSNSSQATTTPFTDIVIDNPAATYVGTWFLGTSAPDKYGADYNYCTTAATETKTATFTPKIDIAGYYTVYCWYPQGSNRSTMAPFTVVFDGGQQTVNVNQTSGGGQWITLVTNKKFAAGTAGYIKLGNGTGEASLSVMADAIRVVLVSSDIAAPSVPTNVAAAGASATSVNVTWTASTDNTAVTGYRIFRNSVAVGTSATASYTDTGLTQLTTYTYTVTAYDAMGNESSQSSSANGTTWDGTAPSIPAGLTATAITPTRVSLAWSASTDNVGVTGYKVYRGGAYVTTVTTLTYVDTGRSPSTAYSYTVSAIDARSNESAQSTAAGATTPAFAEIIIDNPAATITGVWATLTTGAKYGADFIYASSAVTEGKTATWTPTIAYPGNYNVYVWYTVGSNRATNSPYFTQWDGGNATVGVNQTVSGGQWVLLQSNRHFAAGTAGYVKLGNGTGASGKIVVADAVRFVQASGD